jgi:small conductance mechanosensitive channel
LQVIGLVLTGYFVIDRAGITGILVIIATAVTGAFALGSERIAADTIAGIKLFLIRYYQIGDWVTVGSYYGEVMEINLTYTGILTLERDLILIPNADAVNAVITNHSKIEGHYLSARIPIKGTHDRLEVMGYLDAAARRFVPRLEKLDPEIMLEDFGVETTYYLIRVIVPESAWDLPNEARLKLELALALEAKNVPVGEAIPFLIRNS